MSKVPENSLSNYLSHRELKIDHFYPSKELLECSTYSKERPCPHCGEFTNKKYDQRICYIKDIPIKFGTGVSILKIKKWRFRCIPCKKIFTETIGGIKKRRRTTERFMNN